MLFRNARRMVLLAVVSLFITDLLMAGSALAQGKEYPEKQIEIVIGFTPGGPIDLSSRIIAEGLSKELKVPITFSYKPGAGGGIGVATVIQAKPDGYTLHTTFNSSIINLPAMERKPSFDPIKDLTHIARCAISQLVLTSNSSSKLTSFDAMIAFAKQNPGKLNCVTSGVATAGHFLLEYFRKNGINITHVPVKGAAPTLTNILGGHVDLALSAYVPVAPHIKAGELRLLAVTSKISEQPRTPTLPELGFPEATALEIWLGVYGPPNLPKPLLDRISTALRNTMQMPSVREALEKAGFTPTYDGPDALKKMISEDYKVMKEIALAADLVK